jgi:ABC-type Fe3+/spermidine/putrescine transport system ATPase subunit
MLQVTNISFSYSDEKPLLQKLNFSLKKGEHLCVMGESGCGKSTLLKVIYGLLDVQEGSIFWNDNQVLGPSFHLIPGMKYFKYVAQDFDLMPYTTVSDNISKFLSRIYPEESERRTQELLEVIEMTAFADVKVKTLSGGQQQRVAIARALAKEPELLLLDEPFGQIDNFKKRSLRRMLFSYLKEKNIPCIVATHDAEDALSFADKMIVIQNNQIIAAGSPQDLYQNPGSKYVASFFDDVNEVNIQGENILLYPHQIKIIEASELKAEVVSSYFKGTYWLIALRFNDQTIFVNHPKDLQKLETVFLQIDGER